MSRHDAMVRVSSIEPLRPTSPTILNRRAFQKCRSQLARGRPPNEVGLDVALSRLYRLRGCCEAWTRSHPPRALSLSA
jgi:hypothetical protein